MYEIHNTKITQKMNNQPIDNAAVSEMSRAVTCMQQMSDTLRNSFEALSKRNSDHDLLIRLEEKMEGLKVDIKELKSGHAAQLLDHETRLKKVEQKMDSNWIMTSIYTLATAGLISLVVYHILNS